MTATTLSCHAALTTNDDIFAINTFKIYRTADGIWNLAVFQSVSQALCLSFYPLVVAILQHALITFN